MFNLFEARAALWMLWSEKNFELADSVSSLNKAEKELYELKEAIEANAPDTEILYEYVDVIMCVLHSAAKKGFTIVQLSQALHEKSFINFKREWILDETGNTYSHKK